MSGSGYSTDGQRHPFIHRVARRFTHAGMRGADRLWSLVASFIPVPLEALVEVAPHKRLAVRGDDHIGRAIYQGGYERAERRLLRYVLREGGTAVDVGANIGFYTVLMADLVGREGRVVAFEPSPGCFTTLQRNVVTAHLPQVVIHRVNSARTGSAGGRNAEG